MKVTIGIPAYKAHHHICDALASIQIQSMRDDIQVIIANDFPGDSYDFVLYNYPELNIKFVDCKKNTGPGLARQRALDACDTQWITFMDADDVLMSPIAIEELYRGATAAERIIECQGAFYEELMEPVDGQRIMMRNETTQPWVFARLYNVPFLRENHIEFSDLRAMEDGEFNWKVRLAIGGKELYINKIDKPIYFWRTGSEHSITRVKLEGTELPQYTYDLAVFGTVEAAIRAVKYARKYNKKNEEIPIFILDIMISLYFTYCECCDRAPVFSEQVMWIASRFYHALYESVSFSEEDIKKAFSVKNASKSKLMLGVIPVVSFWAFMKNVKLTDPSQVEWERIRSCLPQSVIDNDKRTGVLA